MAWSARSQLHMSAGEEPEARVWGEKALALARERGFVEPEAHALNNVGCARILVGDEQGWELLEESLRISIAHGFQEHAARALSNLGSFAMEERRHDSAARWLREGIDFASDRDLGTVRLCSLVWQARLHVVVGEWSEAAEEAALAIDDPGAAQVTRLAALAALGLVRARRGDAGAWAALDEALVLARRSGEAQWLVPSPPLARSWPGSRATRREHVRQSPTHWSARCSSVDPGTSASWLCGAGGEEAGRRRPAWRGPSRSR